ncbi:glutamine and serine-rich protein 1 isoform X2 [Latimeria chalumnae]|uniref:glutamine and serine-rich protein 1 isoform X2 n=1 Tax=Latimeria chalumnae TaxID=7897 RepID=UPI0006D8D7B3|nr:PREDICTED: glutamine and serine-rich protein 1 isoform X2 [Latimeria chalumnae]|eukprot:XP_014341179.1 PREDICTED: glutamine and serine-rich protein 1 isoform X2 [Latimeria chalumnae]
MNAAQAVSSPGKEEREARMGEEGKAGDARPPPTTSSTFRYKRKNVCLSYGASHPETELLHRQTYAAPHQLPGYATTHHPTAINSLPGIFDTSIHTAGSNTSDTSIMNFLTAIDSRTPQASPSASTLLPQFRAPSWQTGMHSSAATELFVTGALANSGTFPPTSALSAYQHPNTFSTRNYVTTPSLTLQDATFSATSNGLLSPHDPLLQIKSPQGTVPTALTFDRIGSTVLSTSIPPQSSTYRSAQESAPHLLQPQFSLLPSALGGAQQASQPYSTSVFPSSTASIERALQRECSVIKHHQRPSNTQSVQAQLTSSQHSLQSYLTSTSGVSFQDTSRQSSLPCSPIGDATQVSNGGPQQKTSQVTLEHTQSYPSAISSPGYPPASSAKAKNCSAKQSQRSAKTPKPQSVAPAVQTQSYSKSAQNQSSVIASQAQVFSSAQLPSLMSVSQSQSYVSTQSQNIPSVSHSQIFPSSQSEKLPSLYKTLTTYAGQSQSLTSVSQTLSYSSDQQHVLTSGHNENYSGQTPDLSSVSQSQTYSSSHSQGLPTVSQSQISYSAQSQVLSAVSPSQSYTSGQSIALTSQSLQFSSSSRAPNLSVSSPTQNFITMHSSQNTQSQNVSSPPSQKFLPTVQSPSYVSPSHSQTLQNNRSSSDTKQTYGKRKSESDLFSSSKQEDEEFPIEDIQVLQQQASLKVSAQGLSETEIGNQNTVYSVSKADDRYHSQSVIRSNSRPEEHVASLVLQGSKKDERVVGSVGHHSQQVGGNNMVNQDIQKVANLTQSSHLSIGAKDLKQHSLLHKVQETESQDPQTQVVNASQQIQPHILRQPQQIHLPSAQVLLDSPCDLQMPLLQQSILHSALSQAKTSPVVQQMQTQAQVAHQFLQIEGQVVQANEGQPQQQVLNQNSEVMKISISESQKPLQQRLTSKDHFSQPNQHDSKSHFAPLSSICFPESMLLGVDRTMMSSVDDILAAATAAACGVSPQEFDKTTSNESEMQSVENADDSKSQFQSMDVRHVSPGFTTSSSAVANQPNINNSLNASQINLDLPSGVVQPDNSTLDSSGLQSSDRNVATGLIAPHLGRSHEGGQQIIGGLQKQPSAMAESEDENDDIPDDGALNNTKDPDFVPSGKSLSDESAASEGDFHLGDEDGKKGPAKTKAVSRPRGKSNSKPEEGNQDLLQDSLQKKRGKGKGQSKHPMEDDLGTQKVIKRGQGKRQNPRGSDGSSPYTSQVSDSYYDSYQQQEKIRQKIKEVEEKQPEVKTGFIASFLDFLKSGPKQQFSAPAIRTPHRSRRPCANIIRPPCPPPPVKPQLVPAPLISSDSGNTGLSKKTDDELKKNLEALPSFSSDEEDSVGKNQDLQKSISSALSCLDDQSDKKNKTETEKGTSASVVSQESPCTPSSALKVQEMTKTMESPKQGDQDKAASDQLAVKQETVALEGSTDEENTDSGGEGMYRERDEFVVKIEDIDALKLALKMGREPPAVWKVQKALLQKFIPEVRDGHREFAATNSYLGYFGDAKTKYKRVYVKFMENVNKKEYVRVCSKKPRSKPAQPLRSVQSKAGSSNKAADMPAPKSVPTKGGSAKPKAKQPKVKAEPPPKKRKKWKEEFSSSQSDSSPEVQSDEDEFTPPAPFAPRFLNTRTMKETFKSYVELLVSVSLDSDTMEALEKDNDELLLPHMRKIERMLNDNRKRLLPKLKLEQAFKSALESFPELTIISGNSRKKSGNTTVSKIKMSGKAYNRKNMRPTKTTTRLPQEFTVDTEKTQLYSLYHSLHHYKYHMYLICKEEISSVQRGKDDLGQEETVQLCMKNVKWVESLFETFGELLTQVQQKCL